MIFLSYFIIKYNIETCNVILYCYLIAGAAGGYFPVEMIKMPVGCFRFLCYGWIISGIIFILGLNRNGENLSSAGIFALIVGIIGLYTTRQRD